MSAFSDLRAALVADLPELSIAASWPDTLNPPGGFITPPIAAEYATRGPNFGEHTIALDLVLFVGHGDAALALAELEEMVQYALIHLADWTLTGVDPPAPTRVSEVGADYLASVIHISKPIQLGE